MQYVSDLMQVCYNRNTMHIATFDVEKQYQEKGCQYVIGIDEAGRGPLAGPVVAVAALLKARSMALRNANGKEWDLVRDSKTLSEKQREGIYGFIFEHFYIGIGICTHQTVDRMNILQASFLAMKRALTYLTDDLSVHMRKKNLTWTMFEQQAIVLVDGNQMIPQYSLPQHAIVQGDRIVKSIAAASVIAKVTRDRMMYDAHIQYPHYGFDRHKGYGTTAHMDALRIYGPCPIHRSSFAPVKQCLLDFAKIPQPQKMK